MIGLDTNILLRYFLNDDPEWSPVARRLMEDKLTRERPGYINPITLVEIVWVLRRLPSYDRNAIAHMLELLTDTPTIVVGDADLVRRAAQRFREGGAGFADYLIAEYNSAAGAELTLTVDRQAARQDPFVHLSAFASAW